MDLQGGLDVGYTSVSFEGPAPATSMRGHTGTGEELRTRISPCTATCRYRCIP